MRPKNSDYNNDTEFQQFQESIKDKSPSTAKSYKASYKKVRDLLGKAIRDTAEETVIKVIQVDNENINTQQALINICILTRKLAPEMPILRLVEQRTINKGEVIEVLKQANTLKDLPSLEEYDQYLDDLWTAGKYREFIVNYLLRHHYVRNLDLIFDIVTTKAETLDSTKNWLWLDRRNLRCVYIRNTYKTAKTYGQKTVVIDNERFMFAAKRCMKSMYAFPITEDPMLIGYYVHKMTMLNSKGQRLGEGDCLKIIVNHYRDNVQKLEEISKSRGTNFKVLITSYNISFNKDMDKDLSTP